MPAPNKRGHNRKLSADQVTHIRWLLYYRVPMAAIARRYNVAPGQIALIRDKQTYKWVPDETG